MSKAPPRRCSIAAALDVIGDRWSLLVLRELGYGQRHFNEIQRATGAPRDVLTVRLRKLEASGVLVRTPEPAQRSRHRYDLTTAGLELAPVLLALKEWGDRYMHPDDPPVVLEHRCGNEFHAQTQCAACGKAVEPNDLTVVAGDLPLPSLDNRTAPSQRGG